MADQAPSDKKPIDSGSASPSGSPQKSSTLEEELLKEELYKALGGNSKSQSGSVSSFSPSPVSPPSSPKFAEPPKPPVASKPIEPSRPPAAPMPVGPLKTQEPVKPTSPPPSPPTSSTPISSSSPFPFPSSIPPRPFEPSRVSEPLKPPAPPRPPEPLKPVEPLKQPPKPAEPFLKKEQQVPAFSPSPIPPIPQKPKEEIAPRPGPETNPLDKKPFSPPLAKEVFVPPRAAAPPSAPEREVSREKEFPREREFVPSKKEKEFISKGVETSKEIIRTFQKDLLRREGEVKRENKIPEKEIAGFSPPKPPDEAGQSKRPKLIIPRIPIPKISLKFALIIVGMVLFLSGFFLVYQLKPWGGGGGGEPTPTPELSLCDRDTLKNLCQSGKDFPQCDTEKFCSEISVSPCEKAKICESLVPVETCQPIELIAPVSLLPFISEERIIISQKSRSEIVSKLDLINTSNYKAPYMIRILIEYNPDKCNGSWLSAREFFEAFGAKAPENFFANLKENYTLAYYLPDNEEKSACVAANNASLFCYGPRLVMVFSVNDSSLSQTVMNEWETTFFEDFKPFILGEPKEETLAFQGFTYKDKVPMRFKNVPLSTIALNYGVYKNLLIMGTSKNSLIRAIDLILQREEQERLIFEEASPTP